MKRIQFVSGELKKVQLLFLPLNQSHAIGHFSFKKWNFYSICNSNSKFKERQMIEKQKNKTTQTLRHCVNNRQSKYTLKQRKMLTALMHFFVSLQSFFFWVKSRERNSSATFNQSRCFTCLDRSMVIPRQKVCDEVIDCSDLSDECLCESRVPDVCEVVASRSQLLTSPM